MDMEVSTAEQYRLSWEMVGLASLAQFSNADPLLFKNTTQIVPNSQIPDEHWHEVSKLTDDPWDQYNTLKEWADADHKFVRNVRLQKVKVTEEAEIICPECAQGKCQNCTDQVLWDTPDGEEYVDCECENHE